MYAVIRSLRFSLRARLIRMQFVHLHHMNMQVCKITVWLGAQQQLFASNYEVDFFFSVYTSYYRLISFAIKLWLIGQTPPIIIHSFDIWIEFFFSLHPNEWFDSFESSLKCSHWNGITTSAHHHVIFSSTDQDAPLSCHCSNKKHDSNWPE